MLARRLPSILPEMSLDESLEVTRIYSVAGLVEGEPVAPKLLSGVARSGAMTTRPLRQMTADNPQTSLRSTGRKLLRAARLQRV
jgi:predicted ATPase with chaperone activity